MQQTPSSKAEIIAAIESLTQEPGFLYTFAMILMRDLFIDPDDAADIDWSEHLSFQELTFLTGLMVKHPVDKAVLPTERAAEEQVSRLYSLFQQLHDVHTKPYMEAISSHLNVTGSAERAEESLRQLFGGGELMIEPIFYGGSGAYDFQYLEFAGQKYKQDAEWIEANKGISVPLMTDAASHLKGLLEKKGCDLAGGGSFADVCQASLSMFCFSREDLSSLAEDSFGKFIAAFAVTPGKVDHVLDSTGSYNVVESHPIIILDDDLYFLPVAFNLAQSIYESPFYWMVSEVGYRDIASRHRGDVAETFAYEMLRTVFGDSHVHRNIRVYRNDQQILTDIDVLAAAGNKAIIVQAKSKRLTELSKKGDSEQQKKDFTEAVQKSYDQALECRDAVLDRQNSLIGSDGKELVLDEAIDDAYIVCLTLDHYPAVSHQLEVLLSKQAQDPSPLALSVFDLDLLAFYLKDPFDFLYYLRQRIRWSDHFRSDSEIALLAFHLNQKLFPRKDVDLELIPASWAQLIDANYPAVRGQQPVTKAANRLHHQWKNEDFNNLIGEVKQSQQPAFMDAIFFLYDIAGETVDNMMRLIQETKRGVAAQKRPRDFSMTVGEGKRGITFLCFPEDGGDLWKHLVPLAAARKYKSKANEWLAMGSIATSTNIVDAVAFNKEPWTHDNNLEQLTRVALKPGTILGPDGRKVGRNSLCPCGSGKKFKRCHGRADPQN